MLEPELNNLISERIKERRIAAGIPSQLDASEVTGIKFTTYKHYENGIRTPKVPTFRLLAECFNCNPAYLVGWTDNPAVLSV